MESFQFLGAHFFFRCQPSFRVIDFAIFQQWQAGTPGHELCRLHSLKAGAIYRWKQQLDHGLRDHGERIPKSRLLPLQRKIDELERALGGKALEVDILKKFCELKDLRLPEGM